jgi:hypothetical protein
METKEKSMNEFDLIHSSTNPISDMMEITSIIKSRLDNIEKNQNVSIYYKEFLRDVYYRSISVLKALLEMSYVGNDDLNHCRKIGKAMQHCEENEPETSALNFRIECKGWDSRFSLTDQLLRKRGLYE